MYPTEFVAGTILKDGRYEIVETLGKGGMGRVYRAHDHQFSGVVAIKQTLHANNDQLQAALIQEATLLKKLDNPGLPKVKDDFSVSEQFYLVMDFVEGPNLDTILRTGQVFPPSLVLSIAYQLLRIVEYLHSQADPVIHKDIKPANLKLGGSGQVFLLDFGLAKGMASGTIVAGHTPAYASPEQQQPGKTTDARSDIYAVGATLYHLVTGVRPPDAMTERSSALINGQTDPLRSASEINTAVPPALNRALQDAMTLEYAARLPNARTMLDRLDEELSRTLVRGSLAIDLATPEPINEKTKYKVRQHTINSAKQEHSFGNNATVRYLPAVRVGPSKIRLESLMLKFNESTTYQVSITDVDFDPDPNYKTGQEYYTQTLQGRIGQSVEIDVENLPSRFCFWITKSWLDDWESVIFERVAGVLK